MKKKEAPRARGLSEPEFSDGIPVAVVPPGEEQMSIAQMLAHYVHGGVSDAAEAEGFGRFDDEDDFTEEDPDILPITDHELQLMDDDEVAAVAADMGVLVDVEDPPIPEGPIEDEEPLESSEDSSEEGSQ